MKAKKENQKTKADVVDTVVENAVVDDVQDKNAKAFDTSLNIAEANARTATESTTTETEAIPPKSEIAPDIRSDVPAGETVLRVQSLTKRFKKRTAVDSVSFDVCAGEVFGFLGPNGAGKTTTIRMVAGLSRITEGEVFICGHSIRTDFRKAVRNIGGIIENPELYKYMTGWDNMKYFASLYDGITDTQIMEVVKLVRMENRIHEKIKNYSLGMRQRVGIAQSLLHNPKILMLDEPTNGLDPAGIHEMRDFLKMLAHERGIAVFISSHILTEMQLMCDRVAIVSNGKLVAIKTVEEWTAAEDENRLLRIKTTDQNKTAVVLEKEFGASIESCEKDLLLARMNAQEAQRLSLRLAKDRIAVLEMSWGEKTLEETFLELTGSGAGIA